MDKIIYLYFQQIKAHLNVQSSSTPKRPLTAEFQLNTVGKFIQQLNTYLKMQMMILCGTDKIFE